MLFKTTFLVASALSTLTASAAPLLGGLLGGGKTNAVANVNAEVKVFADAFLGTTTGGRAKDCGALQGLLGLDLDLDLDLDLSLGGLLGGGKKHPQWPSKLQDWTTGQCFNTYRNRELCTEVSAYLSVVFYGYERGWTSLDILATLGVHRVNRWQWVIQHLCSTPGYAKGQCGWIGQEWSRWYNNYISANVDVNLYVNNLTQLKGLGLLAIIDLHVDADVDVKVTRDVADANAQVTGDFTLDEFPIEGDNYIVGEDWELAVAAANEATH